MAYIRDEILKAWDAAVARVGRNHEDLTDDEIAVVVEVVCTKCPGVTRDDITNALRSSVEELQGEVAAADRALKVLETMVKERDEGNRVMTRSSIDIKEVATALTQIFEAAADRGEAEPDMDEILDILREHFPGIGMEEIRRAGALVGLADQFNDNEPDKTDRPLPGLPGGPPLKD